MDYIEKISSLSNYCYKSKKNSIKVELTFKEQTLFDSLREYYKKALFLTRKSKDKNLIEYVKLLKQYENARWDIISLFKFKDYHIIDFFDIQHNMDFHKDKYDIDVDYLISQSKHKFKLDLTLEQKRLFNHYEDENEHGEIYVLMAKISKNKQLIEIAENIKKFTDSEGLTDSLNRVKKWFNACFDYHFDYHLLTKDDMKDLYDKDWSLKYSIEDTINDLNENFLLNFDDFVNESLKEFKYKILNNKTSYGYDFGMIVDDVKVCEVSYLTDEYDLKLFSDMYGLNINTRFDAYFSGFLTYKQYRGMGYGTILLKHLINFAKRDGVRILHGLSSFIESEFDYDTMDKFDLLEFYKKNGFDYSDYDDGVGNPIWIKLNR